MTVPNRHSFAAVWRLESVDPSSVLAPPIPLNPKPDDDSPESTTVDNEFTYGSIPWHMWDRKASKYAPPRPEDLACPPTSLVSPHVSIRPRRSNVSSTRLNLQVEHTRPHPMRPASASRAVSKSVSSRFRGQPSAASNRPATASSTLSSRDLRRQIESCAAELQVTATPMDQKAVFEEVVRTGAPTPQAVKQYYRRIATRCIEAERVQEQLWENERGRDGMLFGSELVDGRKGRWESIMMTKGTSLRVWMEAN